MNPLLQFFIGLAAANGIRKYLQSHSEKLLKSRYPLTYFSMFAGIGAFELALSRIFPNSHCVGFSEIEESKIQIYRNHFPDHKLFGDASNIEWEKIAPCDLLVGGFSCKSRSSAATLTHPKHHIDHDLSGDTFEFILQALWRGRFKDFIIENTMGRGRSKYTNEDIVQILSSEMRRPVYVIKTEGCNFTGSYRKRVFFTTFKQITEEPVKIEGFKYNLEPYETVRLGTAPPVKTTPQRRYETHSEYREALVQFMERPSHRKEGEKRWSMGFSSDTDQRCSKAFVTRCAHQPHVLIDRRGGDALVRRWEVSEIERLMGFPVGWTAKGITQHGHKVQMGTTHRTRSLGDSIIVPVVEYILENYLLDNKDRFDPNFTLD